MPDSKLCKVTVIYENDKYETNHDIAKYIKEEKIIYNFSYDSILYEMLCEWYIKFFGATKAIEEFNMLKPVSNGIYERNEYRYELIQFHLNYLNKKDGGNRKLTITKEDYLE